MHILNTSKKAEWSSEDAKVLREFLNSSVGLRAVQHMMAECPALLDGGDVNKTLVRNGEVKGFTRASEAFFNLTFEQPVEVKESQQYPPLDDDKAWESEQQPK